MVQALVGPEHQAAKQICGYCDLEVYDVRYQPVRNRCLSFGLGWCAICFRYEVGAYDICLIPDPEPCVHPEAVEAFDKLQRELRSKGA